MKKKEYVYTVNFSEKIAIWQDVEAVIVSDKPLDEKELNKKVEKFDYDIVSNETEWNDVNRIEVSPIYDYALEPQHIGFTIEAQTAKGKFYGYVAEHPEEPGLPYYSEEPDDAIIFETMQDAQNWIDTNSEGTDFNFIIINKKD